MAKKKKRKTSLKQNVVKTNGMTFFFFFCCSAVLGGESSLVCSGAIDADVSYDYGLCVMVSVSPRRALFITALRKLLSIGHIKSLSLDSITTPFSSSRKLKL